MRQRFVSPTIILSIVRKYENIIIIHSIHHIIWEHTAEMAEPEQPKVNAFYLRKHHTHTHTHTPIGRLDEVSTDHVRPEQTPSNEMAEFVRVLNAMTGQNQ